MLIQDFDGLVRLLPALPSELNTGRIAGFKLKGGHTISFSWEKGQLIEATIIAGFEKSICLDLTNVRVTSNDQPLITESNDFGTTINLIKGKEYRVFGDLDR